MASYVLAGYILLLLAGGLMGYLKAGSRVSLITAAVSAAALALCGYGPVPRGEMLVLVIQALLLGVFALRLARTRKFMPAGLMVAVTALALFLGVWLRFS